MEPMTQEEWAVLDWLVTSQLARSRLTEFERGFVDDNHARGRTARVTPAQRALIKKLGSKCPPGVPLLHAYMASLAHLKESRTPEDLRGAMSECLRLRAARLHATVDPGMVPVIAHNLAEQLYYTLLKEIKP